MRVQRWIAQQILTRVAPDPASFAYFRGENRGILAAAKRHCCCNWLIKMDIRDFFDSVNESRVYRVFRDLGYGALISFELARVCTIAKTSNIGETDGLPYSRRPQGYLPQGAPTSPSLANLAMRRLDCRLRAFSHNHGWVYTRYADDLAFSTTSNSSRTEARAFIALVKQALREVDMMPNEAKTVIAPPGNRRIVLGLLVDGPSPRLTRKFRNNLEAHLRSLIASHIGPEAHRKSRGFASLIGMRRHIAGLLAFAHYVDPSYAAKLYSRFNSVAWPL